MRNGELHTKSVETLTFGRYFPGYKDVWEAHLISINIDPLTQVEPPGKIWPFKGNGIKYLIHTHLLLPKSGTKTCKPLQYFGTLKVFLK